MKYTHIRQVSRLGAGLLLSLSALSVELVHAQVIDLGQYSAPNTFSYQNSFQAPNLGFVDWFAFSIDDTYYNSITATLSLGNTFGIDQLTTDLYTGTLVANQPIVGSLVSTSSFHQFVMGNSVQTTSITPNTYLSDGNYLVKVSGIVTGTYGGGYAGLGNMAPVPLPASLSLLAAAIGLLGFYRSRIHR